MSIGALSPQQLRTIVEDKWQRDQEAIALGLHVTSSWIGPSEVEFDLGKAQVVRADTVFRVREALRDAERDKGRVILLTKLQQTDLGHDVVARLARSRLFAIDHWASLCALFKAKELDRSICDPAIAQALIEYAPSDGYPPVSAGILDGGTVWRAISRHVFDMGESEPDLISLLLWATTRSASTRYLNASPELKTSLHNRLVGNLGSAAESILRFIDSGAGADALALAVVCQVVFGNGKDTHLEAAAARMEQYHSNVSISPSIGRCLGSVATDAVADLDRREDSQSVLSHLQRADALIRQFHCEDHACRNRLTLLSFEQRLARFGAQVKVAIGTPSEEETKGCERLQGEITEHRLAKLGRKQIQVSRTRMALRLVRWLARPLPTLRSFAEFALNYRQELAYVDWGRESICRGEDIPELSEAYQNLDKAILERREQFNRLFAKALADWTSIGSDSLAVFTVEDVIPKVVFKVVEAGNRVLMIVLDGMSWAVCHELLDDIRQEHWFLASLDESTVPPPPVIATIPSVTHFSRASLLSGKFESGDATAEKRNFDSNPHLRQCCDRKYPPVLFHKREVTEGARGVIGDDLSRAILSQNHRVVGVVINAIDDRLSSAEQIRDDWTLNRISPLGSLLKLARDSGRVVILASDHGHVWHRPDARNVPLETGGRWRPKSQDLADDEILVTGRRVRDGAGGNTITVPWSERVSYGRQQNGYHGGATPQEIVCPLVLLKDRSSAYSGLFDCEHPKPDWWSPAPIRTIVRIETPALVEVTSPKRHPTLFDNLREEPVEPEPQTTAPREWIAKLFASQVYKSQKELIRRHAPEDSIVHQTLTVLESSGGLMTPAAFSNAASIPAARLDGLIALIQRLLNVDGYEILTLNRNENKIELNLARLKRQFDLD